MSSIHQLLSIQDGRYENVNQPTAMVTENKQPSTKKEFFTQLVNSLGIGKMGAGRLQPAVAEIIPMTLI